MSKGKKQRSKINKTKHIKTNYDKGKETMCSPCLYINSKPVYVGAVVKLKSSNKTDRIYEPRLGSLISYGHRFVILNKPVGKKISTIFICLLSTSSYLNEQHRLGIKLSGDYNKEKDVYMDAQMGWVIPVDCVKSFEYNLTEDDKMLCLSKFFSHQFKETNIFKGMNNDTVDTDFCQYSYLSYNKFDAEGQLELEKACIKDYTNTLTEKELVDFINSAPPEVVQYITSIVTQRITQKPKYKNTTTIEFYRWVANLLIYCDAEEKQRVLDLRQRGY